LTERKHGLKSSKLRGWMGVIVSGAVVSPRSLLLKFAVIQAEKASQTAQLDQVWRRNQHVEMTVKALSKPVYRTGLPLWSMSDFVKTLQHPSSQIRGG
jgi:hypothetical protein